MSKCSSIDIEGLAPGWGCCATDCRTYNSNGRSHCKHCGHERCSVSAVIRVPILEEGGMRIVPVHTNPNNKDVN